MKNSSLPAIILSLFMICMLPGCDLIQKFLCCCEEDIGEIDIYDLPLTEQIVVCGGAEELTATQTDSYFIRS